MGDGSFLSLFLAFELLKLQLLQEVVKDTN